MHTQSSLRTPHGGKRGMELSLHSFLTSALGGVKWRFQVPAFSPPGMIPQYPPEQRDEFAQSPCIRLERNLLSLMPPPHACFWSGRAVSSPLSSSIYITRSAILSSSLSVFIPFLQTVSTLPDRSLDFCLSHANVWWKLQYFISRYFLFTLWRFFVYFSA